MSTTGSQGGGGPGGGGAVSKQRSMSSQKSVRSGSTPSGPLGGQKKSTLGNGVALPRKPSRSVFVFLSLAVFVVLCFLGRRASVSFQERGARSLMSIFSRKV